MPKGRGHSLLQIQFNSTSKEIIHFVQKPEFNNKQVSYIIHIGHVFVVLLSSCNQLQIKVHFIIRLLSIPVAFELK